MRWTRVDGAHDARDQIDLRFSDPAREPLDSALASGPAISHANTSTSSERLDRSQPAGSSHGKTRFAPRERGPLQFSDQCCPAHSRD